MKILLIDNYDSFTYNLKHLIEDIIACPIEVVKNDKADLKTILNYDKIIFSPGPGIPEEAGLMKKIIRGFHHQIPMFGVCLGHQAIAEVFGASLINLSQVYHGFSTPINILKEDVLFKGINSGFEAGRYHSWVADKKNFPKELEILATDKDGIIMALKHKTLNVYGVLFHPESILTPCGKTLMQNWLMIK